VSDLPEGWEWTTLGNIAEVVGGVTKDSKKQADPLLPEVPYLRVANVQRGYLNLQDVATIRVPETTLQKLSLLPGDILFNEGGDRDKLGRGWVWEGQIPDCIHQNHVFRARIRPHEYDPKFVSMYGNSLGRKWFENHGKQTVNLASISLSTLKAFPVPQIPLYEQQRIVASIEEQFSRLDAGVAALERAAKNLKRMRVAELQAAITGNLIPPGKVVPPLADDPRSSAALGSEGNLPPNWVMTDIGSLARVTSGATPLRSKEKYWKNGSIPWVTSALVNEDTISAAREYITPLALEETSVKLLPRGTLLVAMYGEGQTRGRCSELLIEATTNQACAAIIIDEKWQFIKPFLKLVLTASYEAKRRLSSGGVQPNLSVGLIKRLSVPLPPKSEQERICAEVASRLSLIDELNTTIKHALIRARRLRASVLSSAFSGMLTSRGISA
jgi:type I restriction enzyme, S subunit